MKHVISSKEAKQLKRQGYDVAPGQIVDVDEMPAWIRKRAESITESKATAKNPAPEMVTHNYGDNSPRTKQAWINREMRRCNTW